MSRSKSRLWLAGIPALAYVALASAASLGCSSAPPTEVGEVTSHAESAIVTCSDANLVSATCAGPWKYYDHQPTCKVTKTDYRCGTAYQQKTCTDYTSCRRPEFGHATDRTDTQTSQSTVTGVPVSKPKCEYDIESRRVVCTDEFQYNDFRGPCGAAGSRAKQAVIARMAQDGIVDSLNEQIKVSASPDIAQSPTATSTVCKVTLTAIPIWNAAAKYPCPVSRTYACDDTDQPYAKTCELDADAPQECPKVLPGKLSASGLTLAEYRAKNPLADLEARCTTGDPLPASSAQQVQDKFDALSWTLTRLDRAASVFARGANKDEIRAQVVANAKLLVEMRGTLLRDEQREAAIAFYGTQPAASPACSKDMPTLPAPDAPASCAISPDATTARATIAFCHHISYPYVPVAETAASFARCIDAALLVAKVPDGDCARPDLRRAYVTMSEAYLRKLDGDAITAVDADLRMATLRGRLAHIARWYDAVKPLYTAAERDVLFSDASRATAGFWRGVYGAPLATLDPTSPGAIDQLVRGSERADVEVLRAALTPVAPGAAPPLTTAPLLFIAGDALRGVTTRFDELTQIHDMACRFTACEAAATASELSALWSAVALISDPSALGTFLRPSEGAVNISAEWRAIFDVLANGGGALSAALADASGPGVTLATLVSSDSDAIPGPAATLARVLQTARARAASYQATRLFDPQGMDILVTGLQDAKLQAALDDVVRKKTDLATAVTQYEGSRAATIRDVLESLKNKQTTAQVKTAVTLKTAEIDEASKRLAGLRANAQIDEATFGDVAAAFDVAVEKDKESQELKFSKVPEVLPTLTEANARFTVGSARDVGVSAVTINGNVWKRNGKPGDVLDVSVTGTWSPTCALRKSRYGASVPAAAEAKIGPEGFYLQQSGSTYTVKSQSNTTDTAIKAESGISARLCAGVKATVGGNTPLVGGVEAYVSAEECIHVDESASISLSDSSSTTGGTEARSAAMFSTGMRLGDTPFPSLPAGSLVLAGLTRGRTDFGSVRAIRVLQSPHTAVPVSEDLDFYLVVNDSADCSASGVSNGLTVSVTQMVPAGSFAKALGQAMSASIARLAARRDQLLAQGELMPSEAASLRSRAFQDLQTAYGSDPTRAPASYLSFFSAWIDAEIVRLERLVAIRKTQFALGQMATELKSFAADTDAVGTQGRLLELLPQWSLRSLEAQGLRTQMQALADTVAYELYPASLLRFPDARATIAADTTLQQKLRALLADASAKSVLELSAEVREVVALLADHFQRAVRRSTDAGQYTFRTVVSFPRPDLTGDPSLSAFRKAPEARSRPVWDAARSFGVARIDVRPEDLYSPDGGFSIIACNMATPVVNWAALYVGGIDETLAKPMNDQHWQTIVKADETGYFPTAAEGLPFRLANRQLREGMIRGLFGPSSAAATAYQPGNDDVRALAGISPFTTFSVNLAGMAALPPGALDQATEIMLVLDVDAKVAPGGVNGVSTCPGH